MRQLLFTILFQLLLSPLFAQVKVEATPTGKHAGAIAAAKESRATVKARKKQIKEEKRKLKEYRKAKKEYRKEFKKRSIALKKTKYDSTKLTVPFDSLGISFDSLAISSEILNSPEFPGEYKELILRPPSLKKDSLVQRLAVDDSTALVQGTKIAEEQASNFIPDELAPGESAMDNFSNPMEGGNPLGQTSMPGSPSLSKPNPNFIKPAAAKELFSKIDPDQFQAAQKDILVKKKVFSKMPDSRFPEKAVKRNSLEEVPFRKRIFTGGNISLQSTDPLILDVRLQLGYWINRKWLGGVGMTLREQFATSDSLQVLASDGHGYSLFTRYELPKGFFGWAELEWQVNRSILSSEAEPDQKWQQAHLMGIGREYRVGFVRMTSILLYDFNHQDNNLTSRPWTVRIGFQISKKP